MRKKWEKWNWRSDGIYVLNSSSVNGKPYWLQENGIDAIWYDKQGHWNIGFKSSLGQTKAKATSSISQSKLPHELTPWKYYVNGAWIASDGIHVDESKLVSLYF